MLNKILELITFNGYRFGNLSQSFFRVYRTHFEPKISSILYYVTPGLFDSDQFDSGNSISEDKKCLISTN